MFKALAISLFIFALITVSCSDATWERETRFGGSYKIQLVNCDGSVTHEWVSTGAVNNSKDSDGYFFKDKATGTLVEVSGNIIITDN